MRTLDEAQAIFGYQQPHWAWGTPFAPESDIPELCRQGGEAVRAGKCDAVEFRVWCAETDEVRKIMADKYPEVRYYFA